MAVSKIKLATLFSGIGAIEQALIRMGINHENVFACDNGELELKLLDANLQKELDKLKKISRKDLTSQEIDRIQTLEGLESNLVQEVINNVRKFNSISEKNAFINDLYKKYSKGDNKVKETYLANYTIAQEDFHLDVRFLDGKDL